MVEAIKPSWAVESVEPSVEGTDDVLFLTVETSTGRREVVLKAFSEEVVSPSVAPAEPRVLELLAARTDIPVPAVIGAVDGHPDLPCPFFLAERVPGENGAGQFDDLSTATLERVLGAAGSHLADLHDVRSFDRFGRVGLADSELAVVSDGHDRREGWTDWLLADAEDTLDGLAGGRFDDLVPPIRDLLREALPALDGPDEAVLVHWDYRLGNLLLDRGIGETTAVLDWANLIAGDPVYNLVTVEDHNVNWQSRDPELRRRLRDCLYTAYRERRGAERLQGVSDRKRVYHLCSRLDAMACLPDWYEDGEARDRRAEEHRAFVADYLDRPSPHRGPGAATR